MKQESDHPAPSIEPPKPDSNERPEPVSNTALMLFFGALTVALVLGYLFLNKLVDISREEDCALAHRRNCGVVELSR